jgi:hypothetical protein
MSPLRSGWSNDVSTYRYERRKGRSLGPVDEENPELALQLSNLLGERRLRNVQLRGAGEVKLAGYDHERPQVSYIHWNLAHADRLIR